jgi:hypothetical protein
MFIYRRHHALRGIYRQACLLDDEALPYPLRGSSTGVNYQDFAARPSADRRPLMHTYQGDRLTWTPVYPHG